MTESPLISVIMPVYNCERYLQQAIRSIVGQSYGKWELLIGDDASTDRSVSIARSFADSDSRIKVFANPVRQRVLKVRNHLLGHAGGDLITFQDADDYSHELRFEKMIREFQKNPELGLLASQIGYLNERGKLMRTSDKPTNYASTLKLMKEQNVLGGAYAMVTTEALKSVGGRFRPFLDSHSYQDYDLSLLIAEKYESYALPDVLYFYRQHPSSSSKIVDADRIVAKEIVVHLAKQRNERGTDDVIEGKIEKVNEYFEKLRQPYKSDSSRVHREYAADFMFNRLYAKAIKSAFNAVRRQPLKWVNWMTLQYCVRKSVVKSRLQ